MVKSSLAQGGGGASTGCIWATLCKIKTWLENLLTIRFDSVLSDKTAASFRKHLQHGNIFLLFSRVQGLTPWLAASWDFPFWSALKSSSTILTSGFWMAPSEFSSVSLYLHMVPSKWKTTTRSLCVHHLSIHPVKLLDCWREGTHHSSVLFFFCLWEGQTELLLWDRDHDLPHTETLIVSP